MLGPRMNASDEHGGELSGGCILPARSTGLVGGWAWLVRTPSAGLHAYFLRTSAVEQRSWQVPSKHVDFRGDGGYVIAPPSQVATADGLIRGYDVIAVAQNRPQPVDAGSLRVFLDPPRLLGGPDSAPAPGHAPRNSQRGWRAGQRARETAACSGPPAVWPRTATASTPHCPCSATPHRIRV